MSGSKPTPVVLVHEPDTAAERDGYVAGLRQHFPDWTIRASASADEAIANSDGVTALISKAQNVTAAMMAALPTLRLLQSLTTGTDPLRRLALPAGTRIASTRGIHGPQMAELTMLLMLALARRLPSMLANQRARVWERRGQPLLDGRTAVIVGVGAIGEAIGQRCQAFGMRVIGVSGRAEATGFDRLVPRAQLQNVAAEADFLILVVPYSQDTHHLINADVLAAMKPSAYLVNVARGGVVDEAALLASLQAEKIAGAGLDVFAVEPLPQDSPFWGLPNVILTPHIGGMSETYVEQVLPVLSHNLATLVDGADVALINEVRF